MSILANFVKKMEKEVEDENKPKMHEFILTNPDWLDLPEAKATHIILERLEIVDYIRFPAVCRKWQSIQKEHRIQCSPYPPPLPLSFPWLRCTHPEYNHDGNTSLLFYLPDKQKSYRIPLLKTSGRIYYIGYGHGFLLLVESDVCHQPALCIFNPITAVLIKLKLPPCLSSAGVFFRTGCISSPPTDPKCIILVEDQHRQNYLYRLNDENGWKMIDPHPNSDIDIGSRIVFCNNKFYCMDFDRRFYMIDTLLPHPIEQMIEMDCLAMLLRVFKFDLVNFFGEVVMVIDSVQHDYQFYVYKADFSANKWMRMKTLGDRVLFYNWDSIFASSATDVGCKKNMIYSTRRLNGCEVAWRAFDISTRHWIDGPSWFGSWSWFLPTL